MDHSNQNLSIISTALNSLSLLASVIIICLYTLLRQKHPTLLNRVSLRIIAVTAAGDFLYAVFQILSVNIPGKTSPAACTFAATGNVLFALFTTFLVGTIAINLHAVFIFGRRDIIAYEKLYYIGSAALSLVLTAAAAIADQLGYDVEKDSCWFKHDGTKRSFVWQWGAIYGWLLLVVAYCMLVVLMVLIKVHNEARKLERVQRETVVSQSHTRKSSAAQVTLAPLSLAGSVPVSPVFSARTTTFPEQETETNKDRRFSVLSRTSTIRSLFGRKQSSGTQMSSSDRRKLRLLRKESRVKVLRALQRIILYPSIPVVSWSFVIISSIVIYAASYNVSGFLLIAYIGTSLQGFLRMLVFCSDPNVFPALSDYWNKFRLLIESKFFKRKQEDIESIEDEKVNGELNEELNEETDEETDEDMESRSEKSIVDSHTNFDTNNNVLMVPVSDEIRAARESWKMPDPDDQFSKRSSAGSHAARRKMPIIAKRNSKPSAVDQLLRTLAELDENGTSPASENGTDNQETGAFMLSLL